MVSLVLLSALAAAPVQVTVSRSVDLDAQEADAILLRLRGALTDAGLGQTELLSPQVRKGCAQRGAACLREAARERAGEVLVDVELAWVAGQLGAHLTAQAVTSGDPLASHQFIVGGERYHLALDAELVRFARMVREALPARLSWVAQSASPLAKLPLEGGQQEVSWVQAPATRKVLFGGAAVTAVAAGVMGGLGLRARGQLEAAYGTGPAGLRTSSVDQRRAGALAGTANARFTGALVAAAVSAALATTAALLPDGSSSPE